MFKHVNIDLPSLDKETIDGVRYYDVPGNSKLVSITSITSWINREIFRSWRARVGNCLLYTSPSPRDVEESRMPSSA